MRTNGAWANNRICPCCDKTLYLSYGRVLSNCCNNTLYSVVAKSSAPAATEAPVVENSRISMAREIRVAMSIGPKTYAESMKLEELNADVPKDTDFTVQMYREDVKDIGFVRNVTQWDPTT